MECPGKVLKFSYKKSSITFDICIYTLMNPRVKLMLVTGQLPVPAVGSTENGL